ncbi:MAG: ArsR/SmtB family transcription factor [Alphaproteobacteria bacterium]
MEQILSALRAAGEPTRLRLLALLAQSELTVSEITHIMGQSQPRISRHLKLLADAGLVERYREGNWAFYRMARPSVFSRGMSDIPALAASLVSFLPQDDGILQGDRGRLETVRRDRADAAADYIRTNADEWGRIQALHLPEEAIENAVVDIIGPEPVARHVDLGTGTGRMLEVLAHRTQDAVGIDFSHDMLALARTNLERAGLTRTQVRHGDIFALSLPPRFATLVTIHQVLHFLADPGKAVEEAARVLAPNGRVLIIDFEAHGLEFLRENHAHRRLGFSDGEVCEWFNACGLTLEGRRALPNETHPAPEDGPSLTVCLWLGRKRPGMTVSQETTTQDMEIS